MTSILKQQNNITTNAIASPNNFKPKKLSVINLNVILRTRGAVQKIPVLLNEKTEYLPGIIPSGIPLGCDIGVGVPHPPVGRPLYALWVTYLCNLKWVIRSLTLNILIQLSSFNIL